MSPGSQSTGFDTNGKEVEDGFGDDFDDFEEGGDDADFDDFGEGFQQEEQMPAHAIQPPATLSIVRIQCQTLSAFMTAN